MADAISSSTDLSGATMAPISSNPNGYDFSNSINVSPNAPKAGTTNTLTGNPTTAAATTAWQNVLNSGSTTSSPTQTVAPQPVYTGSTASTATTNAQNKFQSVNNQITNYNANSGGSSGTGTGGYDTAGNNYTVKAGDKFNPYTGQPLATDQVTGTVIAKPTTPSGGSSTDTKGSTTGTTTDPLTGAQVPTPPDLTKTTISPEDQQQITALQNMMATMDQSSQNLITALSNEYNNRIAAQTLTNQAKLAGTTTQNIAMGIDRYAPTVASSIFTAQEVANNRALADLESSKYSALVQAQQAQAQMDFTSLDKIHSDYIDAENRQRDILQKQYDNAINYTKTVTEQKAANLDFQTKTAQNFAPGILKQLSTITDPQQKQAFLDQFATAHNLDPATLNGVVQQYQDTQNQSMRTAMYSMLADNPRAGISMNDINNYDIGTVANKVAAGPDFALKTMSEKADIANKLASAAIAQAQVKMMNDPNSITSLAQAYLDTGTMPTLPNPLMSATVLSAARQLAPSYLPKGSIVAPDGMPKNIGQQGNDQINAGKQMYSAIQDMRALIQKVQTFPGGEQAYAAGKLVGLTPTEVTQFQNDANMLAQNYDVLKGGVRGGSSSSLLQTAGQYVPKLNQLPKYNEQALNTLEKAIVTGTRDVLDTNGAALNNYPMMTQDEKTSMISQVTSQGRAAGYTDAQIQSALQQYGLTQ